MKNYKIFISLNLSNKKLQEVINSIQEDRKNLLKLKYTYGYSIAVNHANQTITVS